MCLAAHANQGSSGLEYLGVGNVADGAGEGQWTGEAGCSGGCVLSASS